MKVPSKSAATNTAPLFNRAALNWLGVVPFLLFSLLFLILPMTSLVTGAFQTQDGAFTFDNIRGLFTPSIMSAFWVSIKISLASSIIGAIIGFFIALAIIRGGLPAWIRSTTLTFSGVAANFAGIPLAFAFIATLGRVGVVTILLNAIGVSIYQMGFNLLSLWGLILVYLYFQIPLMVLIIAPAIDGLKKEWGEAAASLGASNLQYWRMVAFPVLWPSLLGTTLLLFANAFGAVATAVALTGSSLNIVPILLFSQIRGDVLNNPHLGYALAFGMIVITGISNIIYIIMRQRAERWLK
jgi:putative spermidine/putrescine transport system permease protein